MLTRGMGARKRLRFLLTVVLILAVGGLVLKVAFRPEPPRVVGELKSLPSDVDVSLSRIRYTETRDGVARWSLEADTADLNLDAGETKIKNVRMNFFSGERGEPVLLTSRDGVINTKSGAVTASGEVNLLWGGEYRIAAQRLNYRDSDRTIWADGPVKLTVGSSSIAGKGLRFSLDTMTLELTADVHARLPTGRSANAGP